MSGSDLPHSPSCFVVASPYSVTWRSPGADRGHPSSVAPNESTELMDTGWIDDLAALVPDTRFVGAYQCLLRVSASVARMAVLEPATLLDGMC